MKHQDFVDPPRQVFIYKASPRGRLMRRLFDIWISVIALSLSSPAIAVASIAILIEDGPPIMFKQKRVGRFEKTFTIFKLRTMRKALCVDELKPLSGRDPRITNVGSLLRKFSIDELPQFINVIRGDMSLVGPRPEMPFLTKDYEQWQHLRHLVSPGLTCIWQTTCRSTIPLHHPEATALDLQYIEKQTPMFDLQLLRNTFGSVLGSKGAF